MTNIPNEPKNTDQTIAQTSAITGLKWIAQSFSLFGKSPSIWIVMLLIYIAISVLLTRIPFLVLLPTFLAPIFNAGFIYGARALDKQQRLEIDHLFAGFKLQLRGLFRLGILYFIINLLIVIFISMFFESIADQEMTLLMKSATTTTELEQILVNNPELTGALIKSLLFGVILSIPLVMAGWFAPLLVLFHQLSPSRAMLLSIKACNKNMLAFLIYGVLMLPILLLAVMPFGLGLLIILPVIFISQYCSYKSIFNLQSNQGVFIV